MPRGDNPNSKANLKKGKPFNAETARKAKQKSDATKQYQASFRACGRDVLTDEELRKMWTAMIQRAKSGNIKAFELLYNVMGEGMTEQTGAQVNLAILADVLPREEPPKDE